MLLYIMSYCPIRMLCKWSIGVHGCGWKCGHKLQTANHCLFHSLCVQTVTFFFQQSLLFVSLLCVGHISKGSLELDSAGMYAFLYALVITDWLCTFSLFLHACMFPTLSALAISVSLHSFMLALSTFAVEVTNPFFTFSLWILLVCLLESDCLRQLTP